MDHSLRSTGLEWTYLVCLGSCLTNKSQLLGISEFPSRVNPNLPFLLEDPVLSAIAKKHRQTPALVALRYQIQRGVVVLAKSYNKKRIKENIQVMRGTVGRGLLGVSFTRVILCPTEDRYSFPVPSSCPHPVGKSSGLQGKAGSLWGEVNAILPSFQVFDFELTPEDMKAIDGLNSNMRYNELLL